MCVYRQVLHLPPDISSCPLEVTEPPASSGIQPTRKPFMIRLILPGGRRVSLRLGLDEAFGPLGAGAPFSRQRWQAN